MEEKYNGQHYIIEFYNCPPSNLQSAVEIENILCQAANKCSSQVLSKFTHHFSPNGGVSSIVTIEESHISVHTWPEYGYAALDFYTTGERDPQQGIQTLREYFQPKEEALKEIKRGLTTKMSQNNEVPAKNQINNFWWLNDHVEEENGLQQSLRINGKPLYETQSQYQKIQVYQSDSFGKVLALDNVLQVSEKDEAFYHEMISHVPIFAHPNPKRILVIGGGDGGTVRECLKHQEIEELILVEIDEKVIEASKLYFPNVACAFDKDQRLKVLIQDGYQYVQQQQDSQFDVIIIDSSDPLGSGELLFSEKFYRETHRLLKPLGILITQAENPLGWPQDLFASYFQYLRNVFGLNNVYAYHAIVPIYTGNMYFSFNSKGNIHPYKNLDLEKIKNWSEAMNCIYYDEQVHSASFALPKYIQDLISPQ